MSRLRVAVLALALLGTGKYSGYTLSTSECIQGWSSVSRCFLRVNIHRPFSPKKSVSSCLYTQKGRFAIVFVMLYVRDCCNCLAFLQERVHQAASL